MIKELREQRPLATFGLNRTELTIPLGSSATVWLQTIFNTEEFGMSLDITPSMPKTKVSSYQFTLNPSAAGTYDIKYKVASKDAAKSIESVSNTLTLTVTA